MHKDTKHVSADKTMPEEVMTAAKIIQRMNKNYFFFINCTALHFSFVLHKIFSGKVIVDSINITLQMSFIGFVLE